MADDGTITSGDIARAETSAAEASPAPHPETTDTTPPPAATPPAAVPDSRGIPFEDHKRIIDGFHERLDRLSWASQYDPAEVAEALRLRQQVATRQQAGQVPPPDVQDERGEWFYSTAQQEKRDRYIAAQLKAEWKTELDSRIGPIESSHQQAQVLDSLTNQIQTAANWPGFSDHVDAITAAIAENNQARRRDASIPKLTLNDEYIQVAVPKLVANEATREAEVRKKIAAEMRETSAAARDDINPGRAPAAAHKKPTSFKEALEQEFAKATTR